MLNSLIIQDFIIVEQLELNFQTGMTVFSGETGAGKSILIDALSLVLGARSDVNMIRHGCSKAHVSALFDSNPLADQILQDQAIDLEDQLCLRRVIEANGKSKAFINGIAVSVSVLKELADTLVNIHGQHAFQTITKPIEQLKLIDHFGKHPELVEAVGLAYKELSHIKQRLDHAQTNQANRENQLETLGWKLSLLQEIAPKLGQWENLNEQYDKLSHGAELIEGAWSAINQLSQDDNSILDQLNTILHTLQQLARTDNELLTVCHSLNESEVLLREASYELNTYVKKINLDPALLETLGKQLSNWHDTARKLKVNPEQLPTELIKTEQEIKTLQTTLNIDELKHQLEVAQTRFDQIAAQLTAARQHQAKILSQRVSESLQNLNMIGGQFEVRVSPTQAHWAGYDAVEFWVAGHPGVPLQPLAKVASGGELSRISLAITVNTSEADTVPSLIFDEVDSGIGGEVANTIGRYLRTLAQHKQVFCITHLPQVASFAHNHFQISKQIDAGKAKSHIQLLNEQTRAQEIARMLGGSNSELSKQTAIEMITSANCSVSQKV